MKSWLVVGNSGSGKTWFVRQRLKEEDVEKPIYIVGGDPKNDFAEYDVTVLPTLLDLQPDPEHCIVIIDDLFEVTNKQGVVFRSLLSYSKRHNHVSVYVACHTINYSGAMSILHAFDRIVLTEGARKKDFTHVLSHAKINDEDRARLQFEQLKPYVYWICYIDEGSTTRLIDANMQVIDSGENAAQTKRQLINNVLTTLEAFPSLRAGTKALFMFILQNLDASRIHPKFLTLSLLKKTETDPEGKLQHMSIIDFLVEAQSAHDNPSEESILLLSYFKRKMRLPRTLIRNKRMKLHLTQ